VSEISEFLILSYSIGSWERIGWIGQYLVLSNFSSYRSVAISSRYFERCRKMGMSSLRWHKAVTHQVISTEREVIEDNQWLFNQLRIHKTRNNWDVDIFHACIMKHRSFTSGRRRRVQFQKDRCFFASLSKDSCSILGYCIFRYYS
jgi:hypothetical protein